MSSHPTDSESSPRRVGAWILYDLANTIYSLNIVSMFFPVWLVNVAGASDGDWAVANAASMAIVLVAAPFAGAFADRIRGHARLLAVTTVAAILLTALLGRGSVVQSLVVFAGANVAYQLGLQFYDALLPTVASPERRGRIGGIGIAAGYVGALVGIAVGRVLLGDTDGLSDADTHERYRRTFVATAALFALFATPALAWLRDPPSGSAPPTGRGAMSTALHTLRSLGRYPTLRRFLVARAFYTDAINTVIAFMGIYVTNAVGFTPAQAQLVLAIAIVGAAIGGVAWGRVVDRWGAKRTLDIVLVLWMATLAWAAIVGASSLPSAAFWPVPVAAGIALGGTWTADRPFMLSLAPPGRAGEYMGLYGMVSRFAAIVGPLMWRLIAQDLGWGRPAAIGSLLAFVVIGYALLRSVNDPRPSEAS